MRNFEDQTVTLQNVRIIYRNFRGEEGMYNPAGDRNFAVLLDDDIAEQFIQDGWKVKFIKARDEGDEPQPYLPVAMKYGGRRPPLVVLVTKKGKTRLAEDDIGILDWIDIENVDLIIRPHDWSVGDKTGRKAWMNEIYVTVRENILTQKYSDVVDLDELPARAGATEDYVDGEIVSSNDVLEIGR